jgi:hypothetical protein
MPRTLQQVQKSCPLCGREFWGAPLRRYCSPPCPRKATQARHAEARRKARAEQYYNYRDDKE